jgi:hypothetical protein
MELEEALNCKLPPHRIVQCIKGDTVIYQAEISGYPQCTGVGPTAEEALRTARHLFTQLRDAQTAVAVSDLEEKKSERLREAVRLLVSRALG